MPTIKTRFFSFLLPSRLTGPQRTESNTDPESLQIKKHGFIFTSSAVKEARRREARDRRKQLIFSKLARFAAIPATEIFSK